MKRKLKNPWLDIPLNDLEGHMSLPDVGQAQLLSDVFASALKEFLPQSVAIIGCSGGNGFDRISPDMTNRVVGIDINSLYIKETKKRFSGQPYTLELFVGDIQTAEFDFSPVDFVFAGLLFEYVDVDIVLAKISSMLAATGRMVTVVQLPNAKIPEVTPSPFTSIRTLSPVFRLVPPEVLKHKAVVHGFEQTATRASKATGGKTFMVQTFCLNNPSSDRE
jgi:ubiquinone/menaquinone biosynthesis C-methylase UbiE